MKIKKETIIYCIGVIIFLFLILGPIFWCFIISVGHEKDVLNNRNSFFPTSVSFFNYKKLLDISIKEGNSFLLAMKSSLLTKRKSTWRWI